MQGMRFTTSIHVIRMLQVLGYPAIRLELVSNDTIIFACTFIFSHTTLGYGSVGNHCHWLLQWLPSLSASLLAASRGFMDLWIDKNVARITASS